MAEEEDLKSFKCRFESDRGYASCSLTREERKMTTEIIEKPRITVSHSEVESYLRCERQHYYGYGIKIQRINESDSLYRGTLGHATLEVFFNTLLKLQEETGKIASKADFEQASTAALTFLISHAALSPTPVAEITECLTFFFKGYPWVGWKVLGVEYEDVLSVTDDLAMPFVVDLILQDPYGDVWVIDHKFMYDFISDRDAELMPQLPKYIVGMRANGHRIDKAAYSILRYRSLKTPTVESKYLFKEIQFTDSRLMQTIREQVIVSDRIQKAKTQSKEDWSASAMRTANKMVCNNCSFRSLCVAELNDWQPNLILNSEYQPRVRREFEITPTKQIEMKEDYV